VTHLLTRPGYDSPTRRAAAQRNEQSAGLFELFAATTERLIHRNTLWTARSLAVDRHLAA
jgi:hypothetical protein